MNSDDEYATTMREAIAAIAAADPRLRRFGAGGHHYALGATLDEARVSAIEAAAQIQLPAAYRRHVLLVGDGGAGPGYGLLPLEHLAQFGIMRGDGDASSWRGVIALAHLGCGQLASLMVNGPHAGSVWLDARSVGLGTALLYDSFDAFMLDWIIRVTSGELPRAHVPAGLCVFPNLLSSYISQSEQQLGIASGELAGDALRETLAALPSHGIALAAAGTDPCFALGDPLDPCIACATLIEQLAVNGLQRDVLAPGVPPFSRSSNPTG